MALWQPTLWNRLAPSHRPYLVMVVVLCVAVVVFILVGVAIGGGTAWLGAALICGLGMIAGGLAAVAAQCRRIAASIEEVSGRLDGLKASLEGPRAAGDKDRTTDAELDLARFGRGDPGALVAGRLDMPTSGGFPRLVPLTELGDAGQLSGSDSRTSTGHPGDAEPHGTLDESATDGSPFPRTGRLLEKWDTVVEQGELATCRAIYATLADIVDGPTLRRLGRDLQRLADATERSLRQEFAECHRHGDVPGMLAVGRRICALLPDRAVAEEFRRIEPRLRERIMLPRPQGKPGLRMGL